MPIGAALQQAAQAGKAASRFFIWNLEASAESHIWAVQ